MLADKISAALKAAMKARDDKLRIATLRLIHAAIKDRDIAARSHDRCSGLSDEEVLSVLVKMVKQREESAKMYAENNRPELAKQELGEIEIIREFLPQQMPEEEIEAAVKQVIEEIEATGLKDMGKTMAALKEKYAGAMDFSKASKFVKAILGG